MKQLSVIIAAGSGPGPARRCIRSLEQAGARERCEVILVSSQPLEAPRWVTTQVACPAARYPTLRAAGLAEAASPLVAVLSEDYTVDAAWLAQALAAGDMDVTAGVTRPPAGTGLAARAAWLWEYAHLAPPMAGGPLGLDEAVLTPGGNVVYRRDRVDPGVLQDSNSELDYHRALHAAGLRFARNPKLAAEYHPPRLGQFVRDRARWSAAWARPLARGMSAVQRSRAAASRAFLPPLLLTRLILHIARKPRYWLTCLAALPLFVAFACAQAYGEARAYLEHG